MKKTLLVWTFLLSIFVLSAFLAVSNAQPSIVPLASTQMTLYAGELSTSQYGFGTSSSNIASSPGPTLTLTAGDTVTMTLNNVGKMTHNWAIVDSKSSTGTVLWNSQLQSASNPVSSEKSGSVTFTVGSPGNYYYVCQVDGHVALGMWGNVVVQAAVPEFPTPLLFIFVAIAITAMTAYFGRINIRRTARF